MFELFYSTGGHGGPYATFEEAEKTAINLIQGGNYGKHDFIEIRCAYDYKTVIKKITKEEINNLKQIIPDAPANWNNSEAAAWQSGYESGYSAAIKVFLGEQ